MNMIVMNQMPRRLQSSSVAARNCNRSRTRMMNFAITQLHIFTGVYLYAFAADAVNIQLIITTLLEFFIVIAVPVLC